MSTRHAVLLLGCKETGPAGCKAEGVRRAGSHVRGGSHVAAFPQPLGCVREYQGCFLLLGSTQVAVTRVGSPGQKGISYADM